MRTLIIGLGLASLWLLAGCSNETASTSDANHAACVSYVEAWNSLPCVSGASQINPASACPSSLNSAGCDLTDEYACYENAVRCMDVAGQSIPDTQAITACATPSCQ